jgi:osmoprotectant transport system substrate-binding protein
MQHGRAKAKTIWIILILLLIVVLLWISSNVFRSSNQNQYEDKDIPISKPMIKLGSKSFTEQYLFMKMTAILLREHGYSVKEIIFKGGLPLRDALENGIIDQYWEYTNTARIFYHKQPPIYDADEAFRKVAEEDIKKGLVWLPRSQFNSTWAVLMRRDLAKKLKIETISDLVEYARKPNAKLKFATNEDFQLRADGMNQMQKVYGFSVEKNDVIVVESELIAQAVKESRVQVAVGLASDSLVKDYNLVELYDDLHFFPPYHVAPVILEGTLKQHTEIGEFLKKLTEKISNDQILALNYKVDVLHKDVTETARQFLYDIGLIQ